jgi:hypothetical protein
MMAFICRNVWTIGKHGHFNWGNYHKVAKGSNAVLPQGRSVSAHGGFSGNPLAEKVCDGIPLYSQRGEFRYFVTLKAAFCRSPAVAGTRKPVLPDS